MQHVAHYPLRPVIAYARMRYVREQGKVLFYRQQQGRGEPVKVDAVECVARLVAHIPDHQERQVTGAPPRRALRSRSKRLDRGQIRGHIGPDSGR